MVFLSRWGPLAISWFITPINYSYNHEPVREMGVMFTNLANELGPHLVNSSETAGSLSQGCLVTANLRGGELLTSIQRDFLWVSCGSQAKFARKTGSDIRYESGGVKLSSG